MPLFYHIICCFNPLSDGIQIQAVLTSDRGRHLMLRVNLEIALLFY